MYVIIGSHFVQLEDMFRLIALVIVRITLNVIVHQMPHKCQLNNSVSTVQTLFSFKNLLSNSQTL